MSDVCVLGFGPGGKQLAARLAKAYAVWICSSKGRILFCSSDETANGQPATELAKGEFTKLGVPSSSILIEPVGSNTVDEVLYALGVLHGPICFVTSSYHLPRVRRIARLAAPERDLSFASTSEGTRARDYVRECLAWIKLLLRRSLSRR